MRNLKISTLALAVGLAFAATSVGCDKDKPADKPAEGEKKPAEGGEKPAEGEEKPAAPEIKTDKGVDLASKTIKMAALNDESGPAAPIGKAIAAGKRLFVAQVNAGGSGLLPDGWKLELVEEDHGYNPQKSVQAFKKIQDEVLFISTSFGTPNTLPLRPLLKKEGLVAFPASLSSEMAKDENTPPAGTSYLLEAKRAMDFVVEAAGGADKVKAGIVYQKDDFGKDGLAGWKAQAEKHGVTVVSEQTIAPGQKDMAAVVTALKDAGATHVLLAVLPSGSGPILGTAAQMQYMPQWIGLTPVWLDAFFSPEVIPSAVFTNYHQVSGLPFWGEDVPGMKDFVAAYEKHGKELHRPDFYVLVSYIQGLVQAEALKRAIEAKDLTRAGFKKALRELKDWNAGGMVQAVDFTQVPYVTSTKSRVLKPDFEKKSWKVVSDYAAPK